jgi:hypothetical protein
MKNILSSECKPYNLDKKDPTNFLYRSLAIIPKLRDELDFNYYNNLPPAFLLGNQLVARTCLDVDFFLI